MAATNYSDAVRNGVQAAGRLQRDLKLRDQIQAEPSAVDIFAIIAQLDLPLLVRPLKGLLGAYVDVPSPGILVTTERPLSIQRFTAAHELGHRLMGHRPSLDDEEQILRRGSLEELRIRDRRDGYQEAEADAFASAMLMPKWLIQLHCGRQAWRIDDLVRPEIVYQLSLRLGASYEATVRTLERYGMISGANRIALLAVPRRKLKVTLLGDFRPETYKGNVWVLTERDDGGRLDGGSNDHIVVELQEKGSAGFLWDVRPLSDAGFTAISDIRSGVEGDAVGGPYLRRILIAATETSTENVTLRQIRPWQPEAAIDAFSVRLDFSGPEAGGLSRAERRLRLGAA
ncbi:hypothetical protein CFHF_02060 [Caulobacter flavus]|uniref:IrrE N-terminal-like domain-containing protein n=1 Tax=Caulobacter flavus TaxID=1679497 RepID=A0A2N5D3A0_9CAUL|nr:ImmA/IrrE family metallo-endopeptidase [Caulobacter flavus]AYV48967.1 hypothetical protein C1707_23415 [Caulobacter flavus]PLR20535.1 hypothetical protein CFHF_02060 [Caulobacter flavus]